MQAIAQTPEHTQKQEIIVVSANESAFSGRAAEMLQAAKNLTIVDDVTLSEAADLLGNLKEYGKKIDGERKFLVDPLNSHVKSINGRFKPITDAIDKATSIVKSGVLGYQQEQQRRAAEEAKRRQQEMEAQALTEAAAAENNGEQIQAEATIDRAVRTAHREEVVTRAVGGLTGASANIQKRWTFRVTDLAAFAKAKPGCIEVKHTAVMGLFRAGEKELPGIEFYQEDVVAVR